MRVTGVPVTLIADIKTLFNHLYPTVFQMTETDLLDREAFERFKRN